VFDSPELGVGIWACGPFSDILNSLFTAPLVLSDGEWPSATWKLIPLFPHSPMILKAGHRETEYGTLNRQSTDESYNDAWPSNLSLESGWFPVTQTPRPVVHTAVANAK